MLQTCQKLWDVAAADNGAVPCVLCSPFSAKLPTKLSELKKNHPRFQESIRARPTLSPFNCKMLFYFSIFLRQVSFIWFQIHTISNPTPTTSQAPRLQAIKRRDNGVFEKALTPNSMYSQPLETIPPAPNCNSRAKSLPSTPSQHHRSFTYCRLICSQGYQHQCPEILL